MRYFMRDLSKQVLAKKTVVFVFWCGWCVSCNVECCVRVTGLCVSCGVVCESEKTFVCGGMCDLCVLWCGL